MKPVGPDVPPASVAPEISSLQLAVRDCVDRSRRQVTVSELTRRVALRERCPRPLVRVAIRRLIEGGQLEYSYIFGQSYLVASFRQPVDISSRFTIVPPGHGAAVPAHRHAIAIAPGVSFGCGRHPTTRLALQTLEDGWDYLLSVRPESRLSVIDIGTGSGILAIAAACLGADTVQALDIDACARSEARANILLNPGAARVTVADRLPSESDAPFDLVLANLRLPTLKKLAPWICSRLASPGCVVVSGFKEEEGRRLQAIYAGHGFRVIGQRGWNGWSACLFCLTKS